MGRRSGEHRASKPEPECSATGRTGLVATEGSGVLPDDLPILPELDPLGIGTDFDGSANGPAIHGVAVLVEPDETGLRGRRRHVMEAVERTDVGHETRALVLEDLPDRSIPELLVRIGFGPGNTAVLEPSAEFGVALELRPGHEEPPSDNADLVLDLSLLSA